MFRTFPYSSYIFWPKMPVSCSILEKQLAHRWTNESSRICICCNLVRRMGSSTPWHAHPCLQYRAGIHHVFRYTWYPSSLDETRWPALSLSNGIHRKSACHCSRQMRRRYSKIGTWSQWRLNHAYHSLNCRSPSLSTNTIDTSGAASRSLELPTSTAGIRSFHQSMALRKHCTSRRCRNPRQSHASCRSSRLQDLYSVMRFSTRRSSPLTPLVLV